MRAGPRWCALQPVIAHRPEGRAEAGAGIDLTAIDLASGVRAHDGGVEACGAGTWSIPPPFLTITVEGHVAGPERPAHARLGTRLLAVILRSPCDSQGDAKPAAMTGRQVEWNERLVHGQTPSMEPATYIEHLREDGARLEAAAMSAPSTSVPTCPGWDLSELVRHVGRTHRWFADLIATRATEGRWGFAQAQEEGDELFTWYEEGLGGLLEVLSTASPDELVWNWYANEPAPARFWYRRAAQETAIHRWDAQFASGGAEPIPAQLAADGIDEYLDFAAVRLALNPVDGLSGSLHLHSTDATGEWSLALEPNQLRHERSHTKADAAIRGTASDLYLWLLNHRPADSPDLEIHGSRRVIDSWRAVTF